MADFRVRSDLRRGMGAGSGSSCDVSVSLDISLGGGQSAWLWWSAATCGSDAGWLGEGTAGCEDGPVSDKSLGGFSFAQMS